MGRERPLPEQIDYSVSSDPDDNPTPCGRESDADPANRSAAVLAWKKILTWVLGR